MATRERMAWVSGLARLRGRLGRWVRSTSARPLLIMAALAATAVAIGLVARTAQSPTGSHYLAGGRRFYSDDLIKICRALDEQRIDYHQDDHRIEVAADQFDQAALMVAKLDVGRRTIDELRGPGDTWSLFLETTEDRRRREQLAQERILESLISQQEGVVWSLVSLHAGPSRRAATRSAFVFVETEGNQKLPSRTVQLLPTLLAGYMPDLAQRSITLMDRGGRRYLDPNEPNLGELSRNEAREEEISDKIRDRLDWIKGVRVLTRVAPAPPTKPTIVKAPPAEPAILVNQPTTLDPETAGEVKTSEVHTDGGRVLVTVPRSFYYGAIVNRGDRKEPSIEELRQLAARTEGQIRSTVALITGGQGIWSVDVETIPDEFHERHAITATAASDARRRGLDLNMVTAAAAGLSIVTALGAWIRAARRPAVDHDSRPRHRAHPPEEFAPSERVRELVRRDPEAAASVIERWMTQGESSP